MRPHTPLEAFNRAEPPRGPGPVVLVDAHRHWWEWGQPYYRLELDDARFREYLDSEAAGHVAPAREMMMMVREIWLNGSLIAASERSMHRCLKSLMLTGIGFGLSVVDNYIGDDWVWPFGLGFSLAGMGLLVTSMFSSRADRQRIQQRYGGVAPD